MFVYSLCLGKAIAEDTQGTGQRAAAAAGREKKQRNIIGRGGEKIQKKHNNKRQEDISQIIIKNKEGIE